METPKAYNVQVSTVGSPGMSSSWLESWSIYGSTGRSHEGISAFSYIQPQGKTPHTANRTFNTEFNTITQDPRPKELGLDNRLHA